MQPLCLLIIFYGKKQDFFNKPFWDYLLIAKAQVVYLGRSGAMYRSGFARHAAMIGGKPFHEYEF